VRATGAAAGGRAIYRRLLRPWMIPDGRADWMPWAVAKGLALMRRHRYGLLITYGFPFSCHLAGRVLRAVRPMPWVIHQGDAWSFAPGTGLPRWRGAVDRRLESGVLARADRIVVNTAETVDGYVRHFPRVPRSRYAVIPTGYERRVYDEAAPERPRAFRLLYTGAVSSVGRGQWTLLEALAALKQRGITDVECVMAGNLPAELEAHARALGLNGAVDFRGFQSAPRVASMQKGAHVLVLFGMPGGLQVASKLFEYYAAGRPLLVVTYDDQDIAARDVVSRRRGIVAPNRAADLAESILHLHGLWKQGTLDRTFDLATNPALTWEQAGELFLAALPAPRERADV
jgi:glycosyltransferase involved in cell wall biosynthesis